MKVRDILKITKGKLIIGNEELECEKFANYKNIKRECELWNKGYNINEIHNQLGISTYTIQQKLRLGNKYNICNYNKELNMHYHKITNPNRAS